MFGVLALQFRNADGLTPGSAELSYVREIATVTLAPAVFVLFCVVIVYAWSNAVNFTDGLDGLAAGAMAMVCAAYVLITFWQFRNACATFPGVGCYNVRDPLDLALIAAATAGACVGFLWWNAAPAKIFMGDTGSLALGGIIAGLSVLSRTEMLAVVTRCAVRRRGDVGGRADPGVPHHRATSVPDGAVSPSLRTGRVGRNHGHHPLLAADRHRLRPRRCAFLQ